MKDQIIEYFINELKQNKTRAQEMFFKLEKHPDILNEFYYWLTHNEFDSENPIIVEGFTASELFEKTSLEPIGAFNYLIFLRENPKIALEYLKKGLPKK